MTDYLEVLFYASIAGAIGGFYHYQNEISRNMLEGKIWFGEHLAREKQTGVLKCIKPSILDYIFAPINSVRTNRKLRELEASVS